MPQNESVILRRAFYYGFTGKLLPHEGGNAFPGKTKLRGIVIRRERGLQAGFFLTVCKRFKDRIKKGDFPC